MSNNKVCCGMGVYLIPITKKLLGKEYKDYSIVNTYKQVGNEVKY